MHCILCFVFYSHYASCFVNIVVFNSILFLSMHQYSMLTFFCKQYSCNTILGHWYRITIHILYKKRQKKLLKIKGLSINNISDGGRGGQPKANIG